MKNIWRRFLNQLINKSEDKAQESTPVSDFKHAKAVRKFRISLRQLTKEAIFIICGIFAAAFGLESFLLPNNFIDGGATGIALLFTGITDLPLHWLILLINLPFVIIGYNIISKQFAIKTGLAIILLSLVIANIHFPEVTDDKLLVAVFGGFFLGAGIGFSIRGGAVIDGTEVLAIFLSRKSGATIGDIIMIINVIIFATAAWLLSIEAALYSMITYFAASKTLDFVVEGIEEYIGVHIISTHSEEVRLMILNDLRRGVTIYKGERGVKHDGGNDNLDIIFTVLTRLELNKLNTEILKIDPNAFVVMTAVKDTKGGMIKRRPLH
ncbi:YitT family protein [Mesonia aestuariivivens]|uniref:YitT family protein n=1 Tax=Mesonia aestuariivivens TaxID=2796128 RepID=A0ABS6W3Q7_9FLAO|nr:YitT family protein [Mesonia aestuariivivens]MBW2962177.1 YitT family protein [Mesonia aestuariivivens]